MIKPLDNIRVRREQGFDPVTNNVSWEIRIYADLQYKGGPVSLYAIKSEATERSVWEGCMDLLGHRYDDKWRDIWRAYQHDIMRQVRAAVREYEEHKEAA